jgi:hypothetical protein
MLDTQRKLGVVAGASTAHAANDLVNKVDRAGDVGILRRSGLRRKAWSRNAFPRPRPALAKRLPAAHDLALELVDPVDGGKISLHGLELPPSRRSCPWGSPRRTIPPTSRRMASRR